MNRSLLLVHAVLLGFLCLTGCSQSESNNGDPVKVESPDTRDTTVSDRSTEESQVSTSKEAPSKEEIVDAHLDAMGGAEAIKKIESLVRVSTMESQSLAGTSSGTVTEVFDMVADQGRIDLDFGTYSESKGWRKQQGWKQTSVVPMRALAAEELAIEKIGMPISVVYTVLDTFGMDAFLPPVRAKLNGQDCIKLNFVGSKLDIIINDQTKLIQAFQLADFMRITFSDYRDTEGVMMAYTTKIEIKPGNQTIVSHVESVEINSKLDAARLEKPGSEESPKNSPVDKPE